MCCYIYDVRKKTIGGLNQKEVYIIKLQCNIFTPLRILNADPKGLASLNVLWQPVTLPPKNPPLLYSVINRRFKCAKVFTLFTETYKQINIIS